MTFDEAKTIASENSEQMLTTLILKWTRRAEFLDSLANVPSADMQYRKCYQSRAAEARLLRDQLVQVRASL